MSAPLPDARTLTDALLETWPAFRVERLGAWTIREGKGGGNRVSSATEDWPVTEADLPTAEAAMRALGQVPQFMVRDGEEKLDALLAHHGYEIRDVTNLYAMSTGELRGDGTIPMGGGYAMWPPLFKIREIWEADGIGPERQTIMDRAPAPKCGIIARKGDFAAGAAFVSVHDGIAMIHALHVLPDHRRKGVARQLLKQAAIWAYDRGAPVCALAVTRGNHAANPLYASLGMTLRGHYHYRVFAKGG